MNKIGTFILILGLISGCVPERQEEFVNPIFNTVLEPYDNRYVRQQIFPDHVHDMDNFHKPTPNACSLIENSQTSITLKCFNRISLEDGSKDTFWIFKKYYYFGHFDDNLKCDIFYHYSFELEKLYTNPNYTGYYIKSCQDKTKAQKEKACEKKCLGEKGR